MEDYEQLYYDALYTIKQLKEKNESLESDLQLINSNQKKKLNIKNIILEQMKKYKEEDNMKGEILSIETAEMKVKCSHQKKVIDKLSRKIQRLKKIKKEENITFYVNEPNERYHCVIYYSNKTFSTDLYDILYHKTSKRKYRGGYSCYEMKNIQELKNLVRYLKEKGFKEIEYFKEEK